MMESLHRLLEGGHNKEYEGEGGEYGEVSEVLYEALSCNERLKRDTLRLPFSHSTLFPVQFMLMSAVVAIVLLLLALTWVFEKTKHHLEHICAREGPHMTAVLEKLFGEMTVLGFLSLATFVVTKMWFFSSLNDAIFHEEGELLEIIEMVHFAIFFIMIFYVMQVLVFLRRAIATEHQWAEMDRLAMHRRHGDTIYPANKDQLLFEALRQEFILERDVEPPFRPAPEEHRVSEDFPFGRYLSISLGQFLTHAVELDEWTLVFFILATMGYYLIGFLVEENEVILAWVWVGLGWAVYIFNLYFDRHISQLKIAFAAREAVALESKNSSQLLDLKSSLPAWCDVNLEKYMKNRSWWKRCFIGGHPNRQQALLWMDRKGPQCYLIILQINLMFTGLYCAMHLIEFVHVMTKESLHIIILYLVLATLPVLGMAFNKQNLIRNLAQVFSVGVYRRPQVVTAVLREEKTAQVVRSFMVIHKLRKMAEGGVTRKQRRESQRTFERLEGQTFDLYDADSDGFIVYEELQQLMSRIGAPADETTLRTMIATLDTDNDGKISKAEFLDWSAEHASDDASDHERAEALFRMFDEDGDQEITIGEFKRKVDALGAGLSVDDVGAIVNELDTDNNGTIGLHEFEILVQKYTPKN